MFSGEIWTALRLTARERIQEIYSVNGAHFIGCDEDMYEVIDC